jgi:hypothetical protein
MTETTPTKGYCMKCGISIHIPSGVAYTGRPEEDTFIGSPARWMGKGRGTIAEDLEATLASDALILTWKRGETYDQEKIPYDEITSVRMGKKKESQVATREARVIGPSPLQVAMGYLERVQTLILRTKHGDYEILVSKPSDWVDRLRELAPSHPKSQVSETVAGNEKAQGETNPKATPETAVSKAHVREERRRPK